MKASSTVGEMHLDIDENFIDREGEASQYR